MGLNNIAKQLIKVERACGDLRRGMAVLITPEKGKSILAASPDNISSISKLLGKGTSIKLVISASRASYLFPDFKITTPMSITYDDLNLEEISSICSSSPCAINLKFENFSVATLLQQSALKLAKLAELIPSIITFAPNNTATGDYTVISASAIDSYMENAHYSMVEACRTPLTLMHAPDAQIIAYRPSVGGSEHYAIIIGKPGDAPLVRIHSSCYTGDLLASLDCDCRDQLQSAIELMGKNQGGIILYLMQEGRGIGLVNKLRAYDLKNKGMDTVEANQALGFDDDERLFLPAAEILKKLHIASVRLLTNNPRKAAGLEEHGIKVIECVPHVMESNVHNKAYLQTKVDRLGHLG